MSKKKEMIGLRFGKLTVESEAAPRGQTVKKPCFNVRCDCGTKKQVVGEQLRAGTRSCGCDVRHRVSKYPSLVGQVFGTLTVTAERVPQGRRGASVLELACSCGTKVEFERKAVTNGQKKHCGDKVAHPFTGGIRHGGAYTPTYTTWRAMKQRCLNPNTAKYPSYGGRGITVCDRWTDAKDGFSNFLADMGERPEGKTLDRKDFEGNYEPANCQWADATEQANNRRPRRQN